MLNGNRKLSVSLTNVCRIDGDVLLRNNTQGDELHTRVSLLFKTKLTSILAELRARSAPAEHHG